MRAVERWMCGCINLHKSIFKLCKSFITDSMILRNLFILFLKVSFHPIVMQDLTDTFMIYVLDPEVIGEILALHHPLWTRILKEAERHRENWHWMHLHVCCSRPWTETVTVIETVGFFFFFKELAWIWIRFTFLQVNMPFFCQVWFTSYYLIHIMFLVVFRPRLC